jgi:hypothetical protein
MKELAALTLAAMGLGGCVETVKFSSLAPSSESIGRALSAERALTHGQTGSFRGRDPVKAERLSLCLKDGGGHRDLMAARMDGDRVCGTLSWPADESGHEVCYALGDIQAVGLPRDAQTFGYYPVRGWLKCQGDT